MLIRKLITAITLMLLSMGALAENPYTKPDDSWISISGTVLGPKHDSFNLDYGDGIITVEMDDYDPFSETIALNDGDKVTVYGVVDDDLYEMAKIEASSVYVEDLNAYYYANPADEEDFANLSIITPVELGLTSFTGIVTEVNPLLGTFTIGTGDYAVNVDVSPMPYDPLDDEGFLKVETGDWVRVNGNIDEEFFSGYELNAESLTLLLDSDSRS